MPTSLVRPRPRGLHHNFPRQLLTHVQGCTGRAGSAEARRVHVPPRSIVTKRAAPRRSIPLNISPRLPVTHLSSRLSRRRREEELELESSYACQAYTVFDSYDEHVRRVDAARLFYQKRPAVKPAGGWGGLAWKPPPGRSRINHICISRKRHWLRHRPSTIGRPSQPRE